MAYETVLEVRAEPRYWEDATVCGVETDGRILNWTHPEIHPEEWISLQEPSHDNQ